MSGSSIPLPALGLPEFDDKRIESSRKLEISTGASQRAVPVARKQRPTTIIGDLSKRLAIEGVTPIVIMGEAPDGIRAVCRREEDFTPPRQWLGRRGNVIPREQDWGIGIGRGVEP